MYKRRIKSSIIGSTLIELVVAMTLAITLLSILSVSYVTVMRHHQLQTHLMKEHDNAKLCFSILRREIKLAGFIGCPKLEPNLLIHNTTDFYLGYGNQVQIAYDYSDILTIRHRSVETNRLLFDMVVNDELYISNQYPVSEGDILLISNCSYVDVFKVKAVSYRGDWQKVYANQPLQVYYPSDSQIGFLEVNTFFIKNGKLFKSDIHHYHYEMVESIKQIKYESVGALTGIAITVTTNQELNKREYNFVGWN